MQALPWAHINLKREKKKTRILKGQMNTELKAETMSEIRERSTQIPSFFLAQTVKLFTFSGS